MDPDAFWASLWAWGAARQSESFTQGQEMVWIGAAVAGKIGKAVPLTWRGAGHRWGVARPSGRDGRNGLAPAQGQAGTASDHKEGTGEASEHPEVVTAG